MIPTCASSSLVFCMMYSEYKLNKQGDNIQHWCTPFPIWNNSVVPCLVLTCIQISQEVGKVVWYSHFFKNFPRFVMINTVKGFSIAELDVLEFSCFFHHPTNVANLIAASSAFSKSSLNIWKFMGHVLLKPGLENFEHYFASVWDERNCAVVWTFFGSALLWDWKDRILVLWLLLSFPNLLAYFILLIVDNYSFFTSVFSALWSGTSISWPKLCALKYLWNGKSIAEARKVPLVT